MLHYAVPESLYLCGFPEAGRIFVNSKITDMFVYPAVNGMSERDNYEAILSADSTQIASIYDIYSDNLQKMSEEYGDTAEKRVSLAQQLVVIIVF